jgi:large subunit ribosomal protein L25
MSEEQSSALIATRREPSGSRSARRLRREGVVLGVVYGGGQDPVSFSVNARELRRTLAAGGAVLDFQLDGASGQPVVLKELVRHPVTGDSMHLDLMRVDLSKPIQAQVTLELTGAEDAPGVKSGGVLEHAVRELTVEALPSDIPDVITFDVSGMNVGDFATLGQVTVPSGVTIVGEDATTIATVHASRTTRSGGGDEIELETEVVGEGGGEEAAADADASGDSDSE